MHWNAGPGKKVGIVGLGGLGHIGIKIADALADLLYFIYGTAVAYGIDMESVFLEIHRSNMTKIRPAGGGDKKAVKGSTTLNLLSLST